VLPEPIVELVSLPAPLVSDPLIVEVPVPELPLFIPGLFALPFSDPLVPPEGAPPEGAPPEGAPPEGAPPEGIVDEPALPV